MFQEHWAKIVAGVLTPIISGLSASFAVWAAENLPGSPQVDDTTLTGIGAAAALAAGAVLFKYIDNRGKYERQQAELDNVPPADLPR